MKNLLTIFLAWAALLLGACSHPSEALSPNPGPPVKSLDLLQYLFAPKAITVGLVASRDLNLTDGVPAGLTLCFYQLSDLNWFQGNMATGPGLGQLAACPGVETDTKLPPGVVGATRFLIQPGETRDLVLDRLGGARYVGFAGGFSALPGPGGAGFLLIPVHENKKLIFANTYEIQPLSAWLLLRSQSLVFFPREKNDLNVPAETYAEKDPGGTPAPICPPLACQPAAPPPGRGAGGTNPPASVPAAPGITPGTASGTAGPVQPSSPVAAGADGVSPPAAAGAGSRFPLPPVSNYPSVQTGSKSVPGRSTPPPAAPE